MRPGVFVAFFSEGQSPDDELPPVGPLEGVVVQDGRLIAERANHGVKGPIGNPRLAEAERELARATGTDPGPRRHSDVRVESDEGLFVRFTAFGDDGERNRVPELGPFSAVIVSRDWVEADGLQLAQRQQVAPKGWRLTKRFGAEYAGAIKPDIAFRGRNAKYHASVSPTPPRTIGAPHRTPAAALAPTSEPAAPSVVEQPARARPAEGSTSPAQLQPRPKPAAPPRPAPESVEASLRSRIRPAAVAERDAPGEATSLDWVDVLWRFRFVAIVLLTVAIVGVVFARVTGISPTSRGPQFRTVGIGSAFSAPGWEYTVVRSERQTTSGDARARGTFLAVLVTLVNRGSEVAQPSASNFSLVDSAGHEYASLSPQSGAYASSSNTASPFEWPTTYPVGRRVSVWIMFDIDPSLRGLQLAIQDARAQVKLD